MIQCDSNTTSCQLPGMNCGQLYNLTVTAQDGVCDNSKAYLNLQSAPCSPTSVRASLLCSSNSVAVTWERASGAMSYRAVMVNEIHDFECRSSVTHCDIDDLLCGQTYNVSVFGLDDFCTSVESDRAYVRTAPCTPQDVVVDAQCEAGAIVVSWSPNPDAESFQVEAISNTGVRLACASNGTSCSIENLPCGYSYNVTVVSIRDGCESKPSPVVETASAPCVPRNPSASLDCVTNSAWLIWDDSAGALSYFALAEGVGGHTSNCTSVSSQCAVPDLKCGTLYTFHVTAANNYCTSNHSTTFQLETGPCALSEISAETQCHSDIILVSWEMTEDSPLYLVTAEDDEDKDNLLSCNSSTSYCEVRGARCGIEYSIIVSASSDKCSSLRSPPKKIRTAPCVPSDVTAVASCEEKGAVVSWAPSKVATSFHLTATARDGEVRTCNNSVNRCVLPDLHCGQLYSISVSASSENCTTQPSFPVDFRTAPCEPSGLEVDLQCETNSAILSWHPSEGSAQYFGFAQSEGGDMLRCNSTSTSCTIQGLECGAMYNFFIEASDGSCFSSSNSSVLAGAAPCPPATMRTKVQMIDGAPWVRTWWTPVDCSNVTYLVEIEGRIQNNPQTLMEVSSYWVERPYFEIPMPCSTAFNLTVRSRNSAGESEPSHVVTMSTVPCPPQNVTYTGNSQVAELSWEASVLATTYTVYKVSQAGRVEVCSGPELSCTVTDFDPDSTEVTASNAFGESLPTTDFTGPVLNRRRRDLRASEMIGSAEQNLGIPQITKIKVIGDSLYVKWNLVKHATEYRVIVHEKNAIQPTVVMTVDKDSYTVSDLKPRTSYCVKLSATNIISQSNFSTPVCRTTGPPE
uniref:Fibronectin type-III domain-containing protein n=1 Tax=Myripristis murdjan TaxID=586833 RepID=A0A667XFF4_9TELE